ncbi:hypothetical protein ABIE67_000978 [Streptomyces sp. V4I8]|uniref:hypothetical protein n=1 Tax=Streptomyces sp. V4I8 TaxID=3156469 RepID=UPI0035195DF1
MLFHLPLEEVVRRGVAYITRYQRARERPGLLAHAFVPVDTRTGLTQATDGWADWTDGSERIATPVLRQAAAARGLADAEEIDPPCWRAGPASPAAICSTTGEDVSTCGSSVLDSLDDKR